MLNKLHNAILVLAVQVASKVIMCIYCERIYFMNVYKHMYMLNFKNKSSKEELSSLNYYTE